MLRVPKLSIGCKVSFDGEQHTLVGFDGSTALLRSRQGMSSRVAIGDLMAAQDFRVLEDASVKNPGPSFPDILPPELLREAEEMRDHLREAATGYRSGTPDNALPHEPRVEYDLELNYSERMKAKAKALGVTERTLWNRMKAYEDNGIMGLVDIRKLRTSSPAERLDPRVRQAMLDILNELTDKSNHTKDHIRRLVQIRLDAEYGEGEVRCPKRTTFNKALNELGRVRGYFGSAKGRRSAANRPETPYRRFKATRPGEFVLIDSTPLDAFAIEPVDYRWVSLQLTIAFDLFSRSIIAWRFTPRDASRVDAALLLYDIITPKPMRPEWPESSKFIRRYVGIPEHLIVEVGAEDAAAVPIVNPETVVVDRGRIFLSQAFEDACARLGISIHLSRPRAPTDKSHIERAFGAIRTSFVALLPSYKGPDTYSRGKDVEDDAFFFVDEIEELFAEWVATYWQVRHHPGLSFDAAPKLDLSPNEMYEEGIVRAGFVYAPPDKTLYYNLLPTDWRTIQHYGVEVRGLRYDGDVLNYYRGETSPYREERGRWPIRYDPRDLSQVFFYDTALQEWHPLHWVGASNPNTPFNDSTLTYAKALLKERGGNTRNHDELESVLKGLIVRIEDRQLHSKEERRLAARQAIQAAQAARDRGGVGSFARDNLVSLDSVKKAKQVRPPDAPAGMFEFDAADIPIMPDAEDMDEDELDLTDIEIYEDADSWEPN